MTTEVILDQTWYLPTYLVDSDGTATLLTRRYIVRLGKRVRVEIRTDAPTYASSRAMTSEIERWGWRELPADADGDPRYVPGEVQAVADKTKASA